MNVLLIQIDGKIPNLALMQIAAGHRKRGDRIQLVYGRSFAQLGLFELEWNRVYASTIFDRSRPIVEELLTVRPDALVGGTGWSKKIKLPAEFLKERPDYSIYPNFRQSMGFTQRGCRLACPFCVVPEKEGKVQAEQTIAELWRGDPNPRELLVLDNDFFGQPDWRDLIATLRDGHFKISFNQGINARFLDDPAAEALASVDYRDDSMKVRRLYTAWDNKPDERRLFAGLSRLVKYGVKPDHIMVYMLVGYWPGETADDREYRRSRLRDFGARPYPMPYVRTAELVGYQRFVIGAYDRRFTWKQWSENNYRPEGLIEIPPSLFHLNS